MMPKEKSKKWLIVLALYTLITLVCFIITRVILKSDIWSFRYILILFFISVLAAIIPNMGGYFGKRVFFLVSTISLVYANLYNFDVVLKKSASGWEDLASIVGFIFVVGIGTVIAAVSELITFTIKFFRKN